MVTWNRRFLINHVLYNIWRNDFPFKLVVIDNASTDSTRKYLLKHQDKIDKLILNKKNIGCNAFNQGIHYVEGNYVCLQADDHILPSNWVENMYQTVKTVEKKMKVGWICSTNTVAYPKKWYKKPMTFEQWRSLPKLKMIPWHKRWLSRTVTKTFKFGKTVYKEAKAVGSGSTIIPIKTFRKVGLFRSYGLRGLYDGEWNSRIRVYGFSGGYTLNASILHVKETYLRPEKYRHGKASLIPTRKQKAQMNKDFRENAVSARKGIPPPSVPKLV